MFEVSRFPPGSLPPSPAGFEDHQRLVRLRDAFRGLAVEDESRVSGERQHRGSGAEFVVWFAVRKACFVGRLDHVRYGML